MEFYVYYTTTTQTEPKVFNLQIRDFTEHTIQSCVLKLDLGRNLLVYIEAICSTLVTIKQPQHLNSLTVVKEIKFLLKVMRNLLLTQMKIGLGRKSVILIGICIIII